MLLEGFVIKWGCGAKIYCCRLAKLPVRDEDIGRMHLLCFKTHAPSTQKGVLDRNHIRAFFPSMMTNVAQRMGHASLTKY